MLSANAEGCVTVDTFTVEQPTFEVTVTVYVPAGNPVRSCVVAPFDHIYVYGPPPPPDTDMSIAPVEAPLHNTFVIDLLILGPLEFDTVAEAVAVQPFASVTVTV